MRHHALIGLPALLRHKFKKWIGLLPASKEQVEELVDEWIVRRQRVAREHETSDLMQQAALKSRSHTLHHQTTESLRIARGKLETQNASERNPKQGWPFQAVPIE